MASIDVVYEYERRSLGAAGITMLRRLWRERFDSFIILCRDASTTSHILSLVLFSFLIPCKRRVALDVNFVSIDLGFRFWLASILDALLVTLTYPLAALLTFVITEMLDSSYGSVREWAQQVKPRTERVAMLLPVLPDLSHVFIYREVDAMQKQGAVFDIIGLEEGDYGILHPEAKTLLECTAFVRKISKTKYLALYLRFLVSHPARLARLISLYASTGNGSRFLFLDLNGLHALMHPSQGLSLAWELRRRHTSYIHVYGSSYPASRALVASILLDVPFSFSTFVDFDYDYDFKMFREKTELAKFVIASTQFCADRIRSYAPPSVSRKIHVNYYGIDPSHAFPHEDDAGPVRNGPLCLIAIGRIVEKKGFEYLVKAVAQIKEHRPPPQCVIIGDGPRKAQLEILIKSLNLENYVELVAALPNDKLKESYLRPHNILIVPSVYTMDGERDGIPTAMLEAMLAGLAVIATNVSGIPELINGGENGILVPERDENALAEAIETLLDDSHLRNRLASEGRRVILERFGVSDSANRLWSLIEGELKNHGTRKMVSEDRGRSMNCL